jgi:hypothetical protein
MYGELTITAPNGETYLIDSEDLFEIAEEAEQSWASRQPNWGEDIRNARKLATWIANLPLKQEEVL